MQTSRDWTRTYQENTTCSFAFSSAAVGFCGRRNDGPLCWEPRYIKTKTNKKTLNYGVRQNIAMPASPIARNTALSHFYLPAHSVCLVSNPLPTFCWRSLPCRPAGIPPTLEVSYHTKGRLSDFCWVRKCVNHLRITINFKICIIHKIQPHKTEPSRMRTYREM